MMELTAKEMEMLRSYLWQDAGGGDPTGVFFPDQTGKAVITAEEDCVLSGIVPAMFLFEEEGCRLERVPGAVDGSLCGAGSEIMTAVGPTASLFKVERTVLNILSRMSGIATMAQEASRLAEEASPGTRVAGTRKTTPGFHLFEKRALIDGGALPHRYDLSSLAMIKDNHLKALGEGAESIAAAVDMMRELRGPYMLIEVEVEDISHGLAAVEAGADIIMFDNMSPRKLKEASEKVREEAERLGRNLTLEASGGITLENLAEYAPHVDVVSMGCLTQKALPKSFKMEYDSNIEICED